jgi:transposase
MDRGYDSDAIREQLKEQGVEPVIPWRKNRIQEIEYDKKKYKWRNKVERLFHRLKNFRRIATRYEKLDIHFCSFLSLWLIYLMMQRWL